MQEYNMPEAVIIGLTLPDVVMFSGKDDPLDEESNPEEA